MQPLRPNDPAQIAGYRILGRLGAGGMGVVLLGRSAGGRLAAIKLIRAEYADDAGFRARFRREVAIARRVRNRWAVPVVDADTEAESPWLATEFIAGPALSEAVGDLEPLPPDSVRALGAMLAEALAAVHEAGLVHRDVKPGNVLLALDGPRLIDFGIARALDDTVLTATDAVIGSPGFLSPEQAQGRSVQPSSDIFSLGCVLVYAATGGRPFGTGPVEAMLFRTVHDEPDLGEVPSGVRPLIEECLAKDPARRPDAARIIAEWAGSDEPGRGVRSWLPGPVTHLIAERSARMLKLPDIESTQLVGRGDQLGTGEGTTGAPPSGRTPGHASAERGPLGPHSAVQDAVPGVRDTDTRALGPGRTRPAPVPGASAGRSPSRRGLLALLGSAGVLAAGGGTTALWLTRTTTDDEGDQEVRTPARRPVLHLGFHGVLSGDEKELGLAQRQGVELAVKEVNADGQQPFRLELHVADDEGDAAKSARIADRFVADERLVAVFGATTPEAAEATLAAYETAGLPLISVSDGVPAHLNSVYLRARPDDAMQMRPVVTFLTERDRGSVALVDNDTAYSWQVTRAVGEALRAGGQKVLPESLPADAEGTDDYRTLVRRVLAARPGAVLYGGGWRGGARFARALDEAGYDGLRVGTQAMHDSRFLSEAGATAQGWYITSTATDPQVAETASEFASAFRNTHGRAPGPFAAEAYDAAGLLARCVRELGRERISRQDLVPTLRKTEHKGVSKEYSFEEANGMFTGDGVFFYCVEDGSFRYLGMDIPSAS